MPSRWVMSRDGPGPMSRPTDRTCHAVPTGRRRHRPVAGARRTRTVPALQRAGPRRRDRRCTSRVRGTARSPGDRGVRSDQRRTSPTNRSRAPVPPRRLRCAGPCRSVGTRRPTRHAGSMQRCSRARCANAFRPARSTGREIRRGDPRRRSARGRFRSHRRLACSISSTRVRAPSDEFDEYEHRRTSTSTDPPQRHHCGHDRTQIVHDR